MMLILVFFLYFVQRKICILLKCSIPVVYRSFLFHLLFILSVHVCRDYDCFCFYYFEQWLITMLPFHNKFTNLNATIQCFVLILYGTIYNYIVYVFNVFNALQKPLHVYGMRTRIMNIYLSNCREIIVRKYNGNFLMSI